MAGPSSTSQVLQWVRLSAFLDRANTVHHFTKGHGSKQISS